MAHAMLRQQATFSTSPTRADAAERVLRVEIEACNGLLLGAMSFKMQCMVISCLRAYQGC